MKIEIQNIGIIHKANIEMPGLTVLAGRNSVGKSFIFRSIFTSIHSAKLLYDQSLISVHDELLRYIKKPKILDDSEAGKNRILSDTFSLMRTNDENSALKIIHQIVDQFSSQTQDDISEHKKNLFEYFSQIQLLLKETYSSFISGLLSEQRINQNDSNPSFIQFKRNEHTLFQSQIVKDYLQEIPFFKHEFSDYDCTLIEHPYIFYKELLQTEHLPLRNLLTKITTKENEKSPTNTLIQELILEILKISGIEASFDTKADDFVFSKNNELLTTTPPSTSSGIKSLALMQMLLKYYIQYQHENEILLIEEPEAGLHPELQIKYAEIICKMVNTTDIRIVVSSHSPYLIQAFEFYSKKYLKDKIKFYLGNLTESGSIFEDVSNEINKIFKLLAKPLNDLIWTR